MHRRINAALKRNENMTNSPRKAMDHESVLVVGSCNDPELKSTTGPYFVWYARREFAGLQFLDLNGEICQ